MKTNLIIKSALFGFGWAIVLLVSVTRASAQEIPLLEFDARIFPEVATAGMVASQESQATQVGVEILNQGGNAVDAAVAVGFALAVTLPRAGNIGGGGFMLIYEKKSNQIKALDYREKAPQKAHRDMFLDTRLAVDKKKSRHSLHASGVPGTVAGLVEAHSKYGKLPFEKLLAPAIKLAQAMPLTFSMSQSLNAKQEYLSRDEASRRIFTKANGSFWRVGETFTQSELAKTLSLIAQTKGKDFYQGITASRMVEFFKANDGLIDAQDLANYRAIWREPVSTEINKYQIFSMPPPSSGGVHLIQLLNIIRQFPIDQTGATSAYASHLKTEAMKFAYADRSKYLGDPDFVKVPVKQLTSRAYAKRIAAKIDLNRVLTPEQIKPGAQLDQESPQTTHFSVMDSEGNVVSNTYTLNFSFGSGISVPGAGFLLNNEMDDFSSKPGVANAFGLLGGEANAIEPLKRPLSSMTPVIVLKEGQPWLATGSPGGSRIISTVFNFLLNRIVHKMNIAEATLIPRIHHQWYPDKLMLEKGFPADSAKLLRQKGHTIEYRRPWGSLQSVELNEGLYFGFADPRRPGALAKGVFKTK